MLMEESLGHDGQEQTGKPDAIKNIGSEPVMQTAVDALSAFGRNPRLILRARGNSIPNAVAVANILTEKMLRGNSEVQKVMLDTESAPGIGRMISTIEIILRRI